MHAVRLDTVKSWSAGRNPVPSGAWTELRAREALIVDRAEAIREVWEDAGEIRDLDAQAHGDPVRMMALADFALSTDVQPPLNIRVTD